MDHADASGSEGHAAQNQIADVPLLRGNSTAPTAKLSAGNHDEDDAMDGDGVPDPFRTDKPIDTELAADGVRNPDVWTKPEHPASGPMDTTTSLMSTMTSPRTIAHNPLAGDIQNTEKMAYCDSANGSDTVTDSQRKIETEEPLNDGPQVGPRAGVSEPCRSMSPQPPSNALGTFSSDQSSSDQCQDMSMDEDGNDTHSDKVGSVDAQYSEPDLPHPQDQNDSSQANERAPLENAYGPFIHPTDTCLADARERLQVALEQTRLLRASFTEQAYERYLCVMKPIPESLNEIIGRIHSDPKRAGEVVREQSEAIKAEKEMEKKQAQQAGVGLEEVAYFGEGLHLVVLPEDQVNETGIYPEQHPHRGPIDPRSGERREEISAAAAATTEQVFDRIRRIRAIRMGADIVPGASIPDSASHVSRNLVRDQCRFNELTSPGCVAAPLASSPVPSVEIESNTNEGNKRSSTGLLQHLLTLAPDAEGSRSSGCFTAVRSALIARGVGMNETKCDLRVNPHRQRMFHRNYLSPTPAYKCLPTLLEPHQLYRLRLPDVRKDVLEVRSGARESIKSVVEEIRSTASKQKSLIEHHKQPSGSSSRDIGSSGNSVSLGEAHSTLEISLLRRMRETMLEIQRKDKTSSTISDGKSHIVEDSKSPKSDLLHSIADTGEFDPLLAFSVMRAVGLIRNRKGKDDEMEHMVLPDQKSESDYAQALGLDNLTELKAVSTFFQNGSAAGGGRKRRLPYGATIDGKKFKTDDSNIEIRDLKDDAVYQIRGGGRQDQLHGIKPKEVDEIKKQKMNGVSQAKNKTDDDAMLDPPSAGYAGFDQQSQNVIAAATASRQILQHQLAVHSDPYHTAALAHRLTVPIGSHLSSLPPSDVSDFYLQNGFAGNPDWSGLHSAALQHQHLRTSLGLLPGQMNLALNEQGAGRTMLLRDHHNTAAARAHEAVTAAAARYQAVLSSINPQHPFGFGTSSLSQPRSNKVQPISSSTATRATQQEGGVSLKQLQRHRSSILSENPLCDTNDKEEERDLGKSHQIAGVKRPASGPLSPPIVEKNNVAPNGRTLKDILSHDEASYSKRVLPVPTPPKGLRQEVADLIARAKFHEAYPLSQQKSDDSKALLIKFLLSLGAAVPIPTELIAEPLMEKLSSSNYKLRLHEFLGSSDSASTSRDVIIAIISIWLWAEHQDCFKQTFVRRNTEADHSYTWLIHLAINKSLSALATFLDSRPSGKSDDSSKDTPTEQVAVISSQSLSEQVFIDSRADATFPILEDLHTLLDSLRADAIQVKAQERVLLAALTSRCGNMSEAFSNAYTSSIVRAGVALGHENVCEIGQNEDCQASTMLPYDFFHDSVGVWEEPCRPITGYHHAIGGDELKKQAHARSMIQKSLKSLQNQHGLKGGISDGGPYYSEEPANPSVPSTQATVPPLVRTSSGSLKRRGSYGGLGVIGPSDSVFHPGHSVAPIKWDSNKLTNFPYGQHVPDAPGIINENKEKKEPHTNSENYGDEFAALTQQHRSTQELEWEDVANMFFHGGSTRNIDINYDFDSNNNLGKKKILAPFVQAVGRSFLNAQRAEDETSSDEDISDKTVFQRHQDVLDEMRLKLDSALENRRQHPQQRGRKR